MGLIFRKNQDYRTTSQDFRLKSCRMKNLIFIIVISCIGFVSCDGRKSQSVSLKESIREFKQNQSKIEMLSYYPKEYTAVVTDTIISNELKIRIKNYSLENEAISFTPTQRTKLKKTSYHRIFESEIVVSTPTKTIFTARISAAHFKEASTDVFWNNATLQHSWVNQELSTPDNIQVDVSFINPKENSYKLFRLSIDEDGKQQFNLIEENS